MDAGHCRVLLPAQGSRSCAHHGEWSANGSSGSAYLIWGQAQRRCSLSIPYEEANMLARNYDYDIIILGGGSAGIVAGVVAGGTGLRTLLVEKTRLGGACLNTGCVPSKALLHAAHVAHQMRT